ncbi:MAG: UvrD-helicase domain-containing protein [Alistipes sp.]|jgi:DNA helicase-2/ATP-dependent DNA helicase PcrA|nr:UvrD-helicase domain-containing protein [Alistipes sp.]
MQNILENLNPAQREAVTNFTGPSLIVAGAGSGKTRVLTSRIAYMISQGVAPHSILALTFTNKAAAEMRERIEGMIGGASRYIQMGTFHSVFLRILRAESERIGYPRAFTIYDTTDSVSLVKSICKELGLSDKENDKYKPRALFSKISRLKNDLITPVAYAEDAQFVADDRKRGTPQFLEIYRRYVAQCKTNGAMDFDDLLLNMVVLFRNNPDVLAKYQDRFRYILVDEYQDTNHVQYLIVKALAMAHGNVSVVGDDSQSIYSFRGARIENILGFRRDFPAAQVYKLEQNYRSTQTIVNAANGVIARNGSSRQLKKECFSAGAQGEKIKLLKAYTDREEAELVANEIRQLGRGGTAWSDIAVLYRVNALSRGVEEALRRREVPYKIYRGHSFFDRKEIKDLLAYFRLIVNAGDDEAFKRIVNYPARGIGDVTVGKVVAAARENALSLWAAAETSEDKKIRGFVELVSSLAAKRAELPLYEFGREVAVRTGIVGGYKSENTTEAASALENIDELLNSMAETPEDGELPNLEDWLGNVALMTDMDSEAEADPNRVTLMTVHSAKGLEFGHVFIVGLEEELFPSIKDGDTAEVEEERRLFYVALTRARERSFLSMAEMRFIHGNMAFRRPSRFVREIDERFIEGSVAESRQAPKPAWEPRKPSWGAQKPSWEPRKPEPPQRVAPVAPDSRFRKVAVTTRPDAVSAAPTGGSTFEPGTRVAHAKFGRGTIEEVEAMAGSTNAQDLKITVTFDDRAHGRKTLLSKFAKLEILT